MQVQRVGAREELRLLRDNLCSLVVERLQHVRHDLVVLLERDGEIVFLELARALRRQDGLQRVRPDLLGW